MNKKYAVCQLGARMHYAVPRMLHAGGLLDRFFTDISAQKGWPRFLGLLPDALRPAGVRRLLGRVADGVPGKLVTAFNAFGLEYSRMRSSAHTPTASTEVYLWAGKRFCELIIQHGIGDAGGVYVFNSAGLELLDHARRLGIKTVMEQTIAPTEIELKILAQETEAHPNWESAASHNDLTDVLAAREKSEWAKSDIILCGSEFVRQGIATCGGPVERCKVVPYGVNRPRPQREKRNGPLQVLTVGALGLRKGTPYVFAAAQALASRARFRLAGSVGVSGEILSLLRQHMEIPGAVPRNEIGRFYDGADVFLLPSLCEGSATATYEALAAGLPVITTPNAGSVVRDGIDGFIVPAANSEAIVEKLNLLADNRTLLMQMSENALQRSAEFTLEAYSRRLLNAIDSTP
jgi:glycosyltransferase involved in cell wall biosynthesis